MIPTQILTLIWGRTHTILEDDIQGAIDFFTDYRKKEGVKPDTIWFHPSERPDADELCGLSVDVDDYVQKGTIRVGRVEE